MSHHLDSPESRQDPRLNLTDVYVFDGATGTVLTMAANTSLAGPTRVAGFHPEGRYEFKVHLDGEDYESLTYRVAFGERDGAGAQAVTLTELVGADARDDAAAGTVIAEGRTGEAVVSSARPGLRLWAGAAADPFYLDLHQLAHIIEGLQNGKPIELGEWSAGDAASSFAGSQICAIVLEIPAADGTLRGGRRIGVWGATKLATDAGGWHQVNRAGIPMVWPLFRALGDSDASSEYTRDTASHPAQDRDNDAARVAELTAAAARTTGTADPRAYGRTVASGSCRTSCPTRWARQRPSASPASTGVRWPTTRPRSCTGSSPTPPSRPRCRPRARPKPGRTTSRTSCPQPTRPDLPRTDDWCRAGPRRQGVSSSLPVVRRPARSSWAAAASASG